jgi:glucose-1-phosphate thymidylyltransferase
MRRVLLIPAAGYSLRMGGLAKELLPVAGGPVLAHAFRCGAAAGVERATVVTSSGKAPGLMTAVAALGLSFPVNYVHQAEPSGLAGAVDCARAEIAGDDAVLLLMPDTIVLPVEAPAAALQAVEGGALAAVTLHRSEQPERFGVAELDGDGSLVGFVDKPEAAPSSWIWTSAAFAAGFLAFVERARPAVGEWGLTEALTLAAREGLVEPCFVEEGAYHDVGTYEAYLAALAALGELPGETLRRP